MDKQDDTKNVLIRQHDYFQYLFEQEQRRAASIVGGAKVYIAFLVFVLSSVLLKILAADKIALFYESDNVGLATKAFGGIIILAAGAALTTSIVFTILVLKVWSYDRLCDPIERLKSTLSMKNELEVLSKSINDFAVSISRNNRINNKRAEYLTQGLNFLLAGSIFSIFAAFLLNLMT